MEKAFNEVNNEKLWNQLKKMYADDQRYRNLMGELDKTAPNYQQKKDSLWALQHEIDNKNTEWMIDFTIKYGVPYADRTGKPIHAWVIFHHSPKKYHNKIKPLIEREYKAGRIDSTSYGLMQWHLAGRVGIPENTGLQIIDNR
ncbi:hypothetical protein GCM10022258_31400 [Aquimarina gracilis]